MEYKANTVKKGRLYVHVMCHSILQQKAMHQERNVKENKTTQAQDLQLEVCILKSCILSSFRDFSSDCHRVLPLAACKLLRSPTGIDLGMQL